MNYLAHLFLSLDSDEHVVGNFLADQLTLKETKRYTGAIAEGIQLHRKIDTYTDNHPEVRAINALFRPNQGKYAPVVTDIVFDYLLYTSWEKYAQQDFNTLTTGIYDTLLRFLDRMPDRIHGRVQGMVRAKWLNVYTHMEGLKDTFYRVNQRAKFDNNLHMATEDLRKLEPILLDKFNTFFPDVIQFVNEQNMFRG